MNNTLRKYLISFLIASGMAGLYLYSHPLSALSAAEKYRVLSDAFAIPGLLFACVGILLAVSAAGALDGLIYGVITGVKMLLPFRGSEKTESYADYLEKRKDSRVRGYGFIGITGIAFLAVSVVFLILFNRIAG